MIGIALHSVDADIGSYGAVLNGGFENIACYTPHFVIACDAGVGQIDALDGAVADFSEEALAVIRISIAALVEADAADGVVLAVEGTFECVVIDTDSSIVVLGAGSIVPLGGVGVGNVVRLAEGKAGAVVVARVYHQGQVAHVECSINFVGIGLQLVEVAGGPGVVFIKRGAEAVADGSAEAVSCEVFYGAAIKSVATYAECIVVGRINGALEGEHIAAAACDIAERTPVGTERGRARHGDNLAEGHGDVDGIALLVAAAGHLIIVQYGGCGAVHCLDVGFDVFGKPFVMVGAASAGIEADYELFEVQRKDKAAVGGTAVGVELLGIELVSDTVAPGIAYL